MTETRKLYVEGKYLGEIPNTGDSQVDSEAALALMKAKGVYRKTTREQMFFRQAVSFGTTAAYLHKRDLSAVPRNGISVVPFVVNAAFALELYLKTLNLLYGSELRGHDLLELYDALPSAARDDVFSRFRQSKWPCGITEMAAFREAIERLRGTFVEWRYLHEKNRGTEVRIDQLIFVLEMLHETCRADARLNATTPVAQGGP